MMKKASAKSIVGLAKKYQPMVQFQSRLWVDHKENAMAVFNDMTILMPHTHQSLHLISLYRFSGTAIQICALESSVVFLFDI